jgi:hypothetical protein
MLVNHRYRFLFVHIPKTSGAAFRAYNRNRLSSWWRKDSEEICAAHDALTLAVAERFKDYLKFTIVRDPWQLIASAYRFDTQGIRHNKQGVLQQRDIPLVEWLEEKGKDPRFGPFPSQIRYVSYNKKLLTDRICRQDRLAADMKEILGQMGAPYHAADWEKPTSHYYGSYDWKAYFSDPAARRKVEELCREDFEYFDWPWPFAANP